MLPENAAQARAHASHLLTCIVYMCLIGLSTHLQCTIRRINQSYGMSKLSNTFACTSFGVRTSCERGTCGIYLVFCLRVETLLHTKNGESYCWNCNQPFISTRISHDVSNLHTLMCMLCSVLQETKLLLPNSQRINRGGMVLSELVESCRSHDFTDIVVLHEHRGEPGAHGHCRNVGGMRMSVAWVQRSIGAHGHCYWRI